LNPATQIRTLHPVSLIIAVLLMSACERSTSLVSEGHPEPKEQLVFPEITDTFNIESRLKTMDDFSLSNYRPIYIGKDTTNVEVDYHIQTYYPSDENMNLLHIDESPHRHLKKLYRDRYQDYFEVYTSRDYPQWDSAEFQLFIDTTQVVKNMGKSRRSYEDYAFDAYPILIKNTSSSPIIIGYGSHIPLILEVKHPQGEWIPLEFMYLYPCGNDLPHIVLPQNHIVMSSLPKTEGDEETQFRLNLGQVYSNTIMGNISLKDSLPKTRRL
jgi:hypothetical protein